MTLALLFALHVSLFQLKEKQQFTGCSGLGSSSSLVTGGAGAGVLKGEAVVLC